MTRAPARIQLRRSAGWRLPPGAVSVARPTLFGNPFSAAAFGRAQAVALHATWLDRHAMSDAEIRASYAPPLGEQLVERRRLVCEALPGLRGRDLACWCTLPADPFTPDLCHAATLLRLANAERTRP